MKNIYIKEISFLFWIFYLLIVNIEGVYPGCNKGDGTEELTDCISSHHFMHNTPPNDNYQPAVCMKSSTLRLKGLACEDKSTDFCWFHCMATPHSSFTECQCDPQKNPKSLNSMVPIDCYFPKENDCDWYQRCLEARIPCESTEHRYALSYAKKYCTLFNESYDKFRNEVQRWIDAVRKCLQQRLVHVLFPQSTITCETLKKTAFYSHTGCYLRPTPNIYMCNLSPFDFLQISWIIKKGFLTDFSDIVDGFVSIVKECFSKMFTSKNVARLILYVRNVIKTTAGKVAEYVANKLAIIQKWSSDVMFLSESDNSSKSNSTRVQVLIATMDGDEAKVEEIISAVKASAYNGGLTSLQLENGEIVRVEKIEKCVRPDGLHTSFSIDTDNVECTKKGGYCRNNALHCDQYNDGLCEDGARCCTPNNDKDLPCINLGGWCQETSISCDRYESGKCGGNSNRKCCVAHKECENVTIYNRREWDADDALQTDYLTDSVSLFFIHHTVTSTCDTFQRCKKIVKGIQTDHMGITKNYSDIGYSFLVGNDGNIYEGRGWSRTGAHTNGYNSRSLALSFIGNFMDQLPNELAMNAAKNLIKCGLENGYIKSSYTLLGHRDVSNTECPGNMLYKEVKNWDNYKNNF